MRQGNLLRIGVIPVFTMLGVLARGQYLERQIIAASGTYTESDNLELEYTVGDLVVNTSLTAAAPFTQGFQQTLPDIPTAVAAPVPGEPTASPNPTTDAVRITWGSSAQCSATVDLYDAFGHQLRHQRVNMALAYTCDLTPFAVGAYFVRGTPDFGPVINVQVQKAR